MILNVNQKIISLAILLLLILQPLSFAFAQEIETVSSAVTPYYVYTDHLNSTNVATVETVGAIVTPYYNHTDHLNSIAIVSDSSGAITETLDYYPYGAQRIASGSNSPQRQFIGEVYDVDTGLSYLNARYYDNSRGQFISQDPVFWELGQTKDGKSILTNPQAQNSYSYSENNPVVKSDPSGRITGIPWVDIAIGLFIPNVAYSPAPGEENQTNTQLESSLFIAGFISPSAKSTTVNNLVNGEKILYRTMKEGVNGMPLAGTENASQLGARLGKDIVADAKGMVHPNTGGVSVSPNSVDNLAPYRKSKALGGTSNNPTWCMGSCSLPKGLQFVQDSTKHGTIQPSVSMPVEKFNNLIESTKSLWTKVN